MKTFGNLYIGDIIYRCNFQTCDIQKYEVLNIEDSQYKEQVCLSLKHINDSSRYTEYINEQINVFNNKSYENVRNLIGHDENTFWCVDKFIVKEIFNKYYNDAQRKLNDKRKIIESL